MRSRNGYDNVNANLKRYYLHNFLQALVTAEGSFFAMAYFYKLGLSATGVIFATMIYASAAYGTLELAAWLVNRIGVKATFFLHLIPLFIKYLFTINVTPDRLYFVYIINFIHGINLMLYRVPVTAYFSRFGDNDRRGRQLSYINIIYGIVGMAFALFFGSALDHHGFVLVITIQMAILAISDVVLWSRSDPNLKMFVETRIEERRVPFKVLKTYFTGDLPYTFTADLFFIWVTLIVGSFTLAGIFIALRILAEIIVSYLVGLWSDREQIRKIFYGAVFLSSIFYIFVPLVGSALWMFILQFSIGLAGLAVDIPVEREYHNLAKSSTNEISFSVAREKSGNLGMIVGGAAAIGIIAIVKDWHVLLFFGMLYPLSRMFMFENE